MKERLKKLFVKLFLQHPQLVCLTYLQHWLFAMEMSGRLLVGSTQAFIHAFIPYLFITSTSDLKNKLENRLNDTGCREEEQKKLKNN